MFVESETKNVVIAYRILMDKTGKRPLDDVLAHNGNEKEKLALVIALRELMESYCEKKGWTTTNLRYHLMV